MLLSFSQAATALSANPCKALLRVSSDKLHKHQVLLLFCQEQKNEGFLHAEQMPHFLAQITQLQNMEQK